jgi:hypothetical protein
MADGSDLPNYITVDQKNPIINIDKVETPIILQIKIIGKIED